MENMPKTKLEDFIFTVIMAFLMVYAMVCYNISLNLGGVTNQVFLMAFGEMRIMWPVAIVLEMFVFAKPVEFLTKRVVTKEMPFFIILVIRCSLIVCVMCPTMSLVATILFKNAGSQFFAVWIQTAAMNFPMALCWQIFFAGPACRNLFRVLFRRKKAHATNAEVEMAQN